MSTWALAEKQFKALEEKLQGLEAENTRLRALHHTPYADAEHQGGNCVDVIMSQVTENARLRAEVDRLQAIIKAGGSAE